LGQIEVIILPHEPKTYHGNSQIAESCLMMVGGHLTLVEGKKSAVRLLPHFQKSPSVATARGKPRDFSQAFEGAGGSDWI
jgi:hypothetical protein